MKKNLYFLLMSVCIALGLGLSACSDNSTVIPTYPVEKGEIEINGVHYVTNLNETLNSYVNTSLANPMMTWIFLVVCPDNGVQYVQFQCNAMKKINAEGETVGFDNPENGQHFEDMNFQVDVPAAGPLFPRRITYSYRSGEVIAQNVNVAAGTMELVCKDLTVGFDDNNSDIHDSFTFNGTVNFNFTFPQPAN